MTMVPSGNTEWTDAESGERHDKATESHENGFDLDLSLVLVLILILILVLVLILVCDGVCDGV